MRILKPTPLLIAAAGALALLVGFPMPAASAQSGLTLEKAYARVYRSPAGPRKAGLLKISALVNDNDTKGGFLSDLVANDITLNVTVATGFDVTMEIVGCRATGRGAKCVTDAGGTRIRVHVTRYRNVLNTYRFQLMAKDIGPDETGAGSLTGPVFLTLTQTATTRSGSLTADECRSKKDGAIARCKAQ